MNQSEWVIKALWIGDSLSVIEQISLRSFVHHGHRVELFCYADLANVPQGVVVRDANEILGEDLIFKYKKQKSYAAFANWFRYVMLYKEGGVWVDADMIALKPFDFDVDMFFGMQECDKINNAVIGAKPGIDIFDYLANHAANPNGYLPYDSKKIRRRKLIRRYFKGNSRGNLKWGETGPGALTQAVEYFGYLDRALPTTAFFPIHPNCWNNIFDETYPKPEPYFPDSYAIHLWNEMLRRKPGFSKDMAYPENSLIEELKRRYL